MRRGRKGGRKIFAIIIGGIIVGILAVIAIPLYTGYVERAPVTEVTSIMGTIITSQKVYFTRKAQYYIADNSVDPKAFEAYGIDIPNVKISTYKIAPTSAQEALWKELSTKVVKLYHQGRYSEAAEVAEEALAVAEKTFGPGHPLVATSLNNLGELYRLQGSYTEAEALYMVATSLNNLGELYRLQGSYTEAEALYKRALKIREKALGPDHPHVAASLNNLAVLYKAQGKYAEAEPLYKRALGIVEEALGPDHPLVATICENMAKLCRQMGKEDEAERLEARARRIRSNQ
jgi:tetratricopeptide (TPR) repeat protein